MNATQKIDIKPYQLKTVPSESHHKVFANQKGFWFEYWVWSGERRAKFGFVDRNGNETVLFNFTIRKGDDYTKVVNIAKLKADLIPFFQKWESLTQYAHNEIQYFAPDKIADLKSDLLALHEKHTH